ncbi:MAG: ISL3 family transposase [Bdellovibrionaceae bacterium]|nr:ISL3 family transposase [Pseudobdellovibrionaceae bacterium]
MAPIHSRVSHFVLSPELKLTDHRFLGRFQTIFDVHKESSFEVCPKCATKSFSVHDRRWVKIKDAPIRGNGILLRIRKRRFRCPACKAVFTEPVGLVQKGYRTTRRFRKNLAWSCNNLLDLKRVQKAHKCSAWLVYKVFYEQLELEHRKIKNDPWPKTIGIDEHTFKRNKNKGYREFATVLVDYNHRRIKEVVHGKTAAGLQRDLYHIQGRENVRNVVLDLCDPFKKFAKEHFPNARIVADKFHVLRILNPAINKRRTSITGDKRSNPVRKLLLRNGFKLEYFERKALWKWLDQNPDVKEVYFYKEALHQLYRTKGYHKASRALTRLTDEMAHSNLPEIKTLRKTLMKWRNEILNYFITRLTNARTEGFNNLAKLYQKRAFGYKNFENYRLRLLNAGI